MDFMGITSMGVSFDGSFNGDSSYVLLSQSFCCIGNCGLDSQRASSASSVRKQTNASTSTVSSFRVSRDLARNFVPLEGNMEHKRFFVWDS